MKSKITKTQKLLMKGIVFFLVLILMLSYSSGLNIVFGEETTEVVDRNEDLFSEVDRTLISLTKDIDNMLRQIEELNSTFKYEDFFTEINSESTIYISNEIELRALSIYVAEGYDCVGKTFVLTKNIALTSALEWNPIGDTTTPFRGIFDGAGFTISGIKISQKQSYAGFIGYIESGTIKNLNISNSLINIPPEVDNVNSNDLVSSSKVSYSYLGAIAGYANNSTIINCKNNTNVSGGNDVGGIVGFCNDTNINNCSNKGYVNGFVEVGGIVGRFETTTANNTSIIRCTNSGRVHSVLGNEGGIAGYVYGIANIENSMNSGDVTCSEAIVKTPYNADTSSEMIPENVGGIVGWISGKTLSDVSIIKNCINTKNAQVVGYKDVGGIVGQLGGNTTGKAVAQNCINYSDNIYASDIAEEEQTPLINKGGYSAGQIAGSVGLATGKKFSTMTAEEQKAIGIISECYYIVSSGTDKTASDKSTEDTVKAYGHSEYIVNGNQLILDQYDNQEGGFSTPNTNEYPEPAILKIEDNELSYKYQLEEDGDYSVITDEILEENEYLDFKYNQTNTQLYIDNIKPEIQRVEINNSGAPSIAVKGDTLTIEISYDESINLNRIQPIIRLFGNKYATYTGISSDGNELTFKYTLDGSESGAINNTVYLTAIVGDIFENLNNTSEQLTIDRGNDIIAVTGDISTTCILTNEEYNIAYKIESPKLIDGKLYFNGDDTLKITAILGGRLTSDITESIVPSLTVNINGEDKIIETTTDKIDVNNGTIEYEFPSVGYNGQITTVYLNTTSGNVIYGEEDNIKTNTLGSGTVVDFTDYNIFIDSIAPTLALSASPSIINEAGRYSVGEEVTIKATTSEEINLEESIRPEFIVSFSESGFGKYNNKNDNTPNAIYVETVKNIDDNGKVTYTYKYRYIIQEGDEGALQYNFADENGKIVDIAGNEVILTKYPESPSTKINTEDLEDIMLSDDVTTVTYKIYKNNVEITDFSNNTYYEKGDKIKVEAIFNNPLYKSYGSSEELVDSETAPKLIINGINSGLAGAVSNDGKKVTYEYQIDNEENQKLTQFKLQTSNRVFPLTEEGYNTINAGTINTINIEDANLYIHNGVATFEENNLYADTTIPTVEIVPVKEITNIPNGITDLPISISNNREVKYKFIWSEEVIGFDPYDITVNGGSKGILSNPERSNGKVTYTMTITSNIENGNDGQLQVIVEQDAVQDSVGLRNIRRENVLNIDRTAPTVEITADKDTINANDTVTYTFNWSEAVTDFTADDITVTNGEIVAGSFSGNGVVYTVEVKSSNGNDLSVGVIDGVCTDIAGNENIGNGHVIGVRPTVEIVAKDVVNSLTKENEITYIFNWSEEIQGFTEDDITVNNGSKVSNSFGRIQLEGVDTNSYEIKIITSVEQGNVGDLQVIVEEDAVRDLVGLGNVRCENLIRVDKQSPILISLEAYSKSNVIDTAEVSQVKEKYKSGDTVTIVATFSENIENSEIPTLTLQFNESGYANGTVDTEVKEGNKITYTYTINEEDKGILSVAEFTGKVKDAAGNETVVTKRALDGNTVIADSEAPKLVGITAIAPEFEYEDLLSNPDETRRYGKGIQIKFIAEFDENIYSFADRTINNITSSTAPNLTFKFGNTSRQATFSKVDGKTIEYVYTIGENNNNDNGPLTFINISGTGTKAIYDIAGNFTTEVTANLVEYLGQTRLENEEHIVADTTAPAVSLKVINAENTEITGLNNNYLAGDVLTITATTNEYVYDKDGNNLSKLEADTKNALGIKFGGTAVNGITCKEVTYEDNKTIFTYEYTITNGNQGPIQLSFVSGSYYDIALNGNTTGQTDSNSISVIADTENPYYEDQPGIEFSNGRYTVTFNEDLYYLDEDNTVRSFGDVSYAPTLKFENDETKYTARVSRNVLTYSGVYVNAKPYLSASRLCDAAGNLYSYFDQVAPELGTIEVTSPVTRTYKVGQEVIIVATFDEDIVATTIPTLNLQFSKSGDAKGTVNGIIEDNTIKYTYTIDEQDEGVLSIKDFTGTVKDLVGNETQVAKKDLTGSTITADSVGPKVTITSDVEGDRTNKNKIIYTFTWDEPVTGFTADILEVLNGSKGNFTPSNDGKVYTLEVYTANEGRQIVTVPANKCTDEAGNFNSEATTMNSIVIDYTKPEVRAKVNGGNYVVDTQNEYSTLKETLVVNEEISKFELIWSDSTTTPVEGWESLNINNIEINNDIQLETNINKLSVGENGTSYYLYIKVTDKAGNEAIGRTNAFIVRNENITFQADITEITNSNVTVTVNYGDKGLTQNRRAGIQGKTQSADPNTVILTENGKVYAEASDIAGNKVYNVFSVENIDKTTSLEIISITKNTNNPTDSVTLTVNAVCEGSEIDVYSIDNGETWQKSNIFTITANGTYTILVKDKTGNQATRSIVISNITQTEDSYFRITNYTQKIQSNVKYVVGISTYTNLSDFKEYIQTNMTYTVYDRNGNVVSDNDIIATNMKIEVSNGDEYILVVRGDLNSDGKADISDLGVMASYYIGKASLGVPYKLAADIISDGVIDISDISVLARAVTQKIRL